MSLSTLSSHLVVVEINAKLLSSKALCTFAMMYGNVIGGVPILDSAKDDIGDLCEEVRQQHRLGNSCLQNQQASLANHLGRKGRKG